MSVSNVLNGRAVSVRIKDAVLQAIDDLDYTPNQAAWQLASAAPMFIGLVHSNDEHPLSSALLTSPESDGASWRAIAAVTHCL